MGVAAGTGVAATLVFLSVLSQPFDPRLSDWFRQASVPEAHGRNLVNVIIVDFRALDTLGEITVLGLAAIAAAAVITGLRRRAKEDRP
jgi:multicomponent Na+:H+ antiporter subunit A